MKLYYFETPSPRMACAVARHVGAPVDYVRVDLAQGEHRRPEYLAVNPNGKVPTLVDGDLTLWEAPAIACHLALGAGSDLWPADDAKRIDILRWVNWNTAHFSRHAGTLYVQHVINPLLGADAPDAAVVEEAAGYFKQFATVLDRQLRGREFLVGGRLSVADFAVGTFLPVAGPSGLALDGFDEIGRWYGQLQALPAWRDPFPAQA